MTRALCNISPLPGGIVIGVGFGNNYDSKWCEEAFRLGFDTRWIDVSKVACDLAIANLKNAGRPLYSVINGDIESILTDPDSADLDMNKVQAFYFWRTFGCLSRPQGRSVLRLLGCRFLSNHDNGSKRIIVMGGTFKEQNPGFTGKTTTVWSKKTLLYRLSQSANCRVESINEALYPYYSQNVLAMTLQARIS